MEYYHCLRMIRSHARSALMFKENYSTICPDLRIQIWACEETGTFVLSKEFACNWLSSELESVEVKECELNQNL